MFDIQSIIIVNFKSYGGNHHFDLPTTDGLYYLTGENRVEPRLESNGAGKSTILDAIYWCLYGKTLRGLRGNDVITWGEKSCTVILRLVVGKRTFVITRSQSPNSLLVDDQPVDQETLQKHIILGEDSFLYSVVMPQFGQSFFELTPTAKLTLFSQIMGLDYWLGRSTAAAEWAERIKGAALTLQQKILFFQQQHKTADAELAELLDKEKAFEKEQEQAIHELNKDMDVDDLKILELRDAKKVFEEAIKHDANAHGHKTKEMQSVEATFSKYLERRETLGSELAKVRAVLGTMEAAQKSLSAVASTCPTCLQKVDAKHLRQEKYQLGLDIIRQETAFSLIQQQMDETVRFATKTKKDLQELTSVVAAINRACDQDQKNLTLVESEIDILRNRVASTKKQITAEQKRTNPFTALIDAKDSAMHSLGKQLKLSETNLTELNAEFEAVNYWVGGFKRLRLFLIEETLRAFELEVNSSLASLGLEDWQIEFDVERENKSGGVTKGFVVFIRNSTHPEPVRFEAWSGGEGQRLQLAGDLGLANLIMLQAGLHNTVEFYDEPSKHLSRTGLLDLAETLHQRAVTDGKRIFLIDHHTVEFGEFADTIKVIKTEKGSTLEYAA